MSNSEHPVIDEKCNYYCNGKIHATVLLIENFATKESIIESLEFYYSSLGYKIIDVRKAEINKQKVFEQIEATTNGAKLILPFDSNEYTMPDDDISSFEPWLIFLEDLK